MRENGVPGPHTSSARRLRPETTSRRHRPRVRSWLGGLATLLTLGLLVAGVAPLGSSGVRDVAAQFHAPVDATSEELLVSPRRLVCLGADPCPSLFHRWTVPRRLGRPEFAGLVSAAGWTFRVEGDCSPDPNNFGLVPLCSASGEVDGYGVTVTQLGESDTQTTVVTLSVRPHR